MKPRNFPGRKNDRRIRALARMGKSAHGKRKRPRLNPRTEVQLNAEYLALHSTIIVPDIARAIRTKKDRSARGRLSR